jgi:lipopolysaccharide transport system permease protein
MNFLIYFGQKNNLMHVSNFKPITSYSKSKWLFEISPERSKFKLNFKEIYQYRDLLMLFIRRDIVSIYKQTILGPLWYFISPLLASITQYWVFGRLAELPSDGTPYFLFVLGGNVLWSYFQTSLTVTSNTFSANQGIFGKVYFPRAIVPLSVTVSNLFQFGIKLLLLITFITAMGLFSKMNVYVFTLPLLIIVMALTSMGLGMIVSSMTTKYRDFSQLMGFAVGLAMYVTPVIYPTSMLLDKISPEKQWLIYANPLTSVFDVFRYAFFSSGSVNLFGVLYTVAFAIVVYVLGLFVFNRVEKSFMDSI